MITHAAESKYRNAADCTQQKFLCDDKNRPLAMLENNLTMFISVLTF